MPSTPPGRGFAAASCPKCTVPDVTSGTRPMGSHRSLPACFHPDEEFGFHWEKAAGRADVHRKKKYKKIIRRVISEGRQWGSPTAAPSWSQAESPGRPGMLHGENPLPLSSVGPRPPKHTPVPLDICSHPAFPRVIKPTQLPRRPQ